MFKIMLLPFFCVILGAGVVHAEASGRAETRSLSTMPYYDGSMDQVVSQKWVAIDGHDVFEVELMATLQKNDSMFSQIQPVADDHIDDAVDNSLRVFYRDEALEQTLVIALESYDKKVEVTKYHFPSVAQ
ncbi:MAG: hypothetical protein Q9O24_12395 [Gammaproteobacteria bacterium]|nr:hypothetical protein [Gammaproteobacteria bacterium]